MVSGGGLGAGLVAHSETLGADDDVHAGAAVGGDEVFAEGGAVVFAQAGAENGERVAAAPFKGGDDGVNEL